jgi:hypothetical protein
MLSGDVARRLTPHELWVKAVRDNAHLAGLEQVEAHLAAALSGPKFAHYDEPAIAREARALLKSVRDFEEQLWAEGRSAEDISAAIKARYGFDVSAREIAEGQVWWRLEELAGGSRSPGVLEEPDWRDRIEATGTAPGSISQVSDSSDPNARPAVPSRLSPRETPEPQRLRAKKLTDEDKNRIVALWEDGMPPHKIAEKMSQESGQYVRLTSVADVIDREIGARKGTGRVPKTDRRVWSDRELEILAKPETAALPAKEVAELLQRETGAARSVEAIRTKRRLTDAERPERGLRPGTFRWTAEAIAKLKSDDVARMTAAEAAEVLNDLYSPEVRALTAKAVRVQRSRLGISTGHFGGSAAGEPRLMLRPARGDRSARWVIYDQGREISLRLPESARAEAEQRLAAYKASKSSASSKPEPAEPGSVAEADRIGTMGLLTQACKK